MAAVRKKKTVKKTTPEGMKRFIEKTWPKARVELEKGIIEAKKVISEGERQLNRLTDQGLKRMRILVLQQRKDKAFRSLGRQAASLDPEAWAGDERIAKILQDIRDFDEEIARIKKELRKS